MTPTDFDVVVVGSGVCGAVCAWQLAERGHRVLILEAGAEGAERIELVRSFASSASPYRGDDPAARAPAPDTVASYEDYYDIPPRLFRSGYLRRVGGSTWHFLGNVPRFVPNDFRLRSEYGVGVDWPIGYDDLEEDYCQAEALMGVAGDHQQWDGLFGARRSRPFPMSKIWESYSDQRVRSGIESLDIDGIRPRLMSTPQARNSEPYDGRPACAGNSSCVPLCPIQAKYDAGIHVRKAVRSGAELRSRAVVTSLRLGDASDGVEEVVYRDWDGEEHRVRAQIAVVAAHAIETPKILLASSGSGGLANRSGQVGRNLMDHAQMAGRCLTPEPVYPFRGPPTTSGIDAFRDGPFRSRHAAFRMSLGNDGWGRGESPAKTFTKLLDGEPMFGARLQAKIRHHFVRMFRISFSTEMLPDPDNRVTLSDKVDSLGIARPKISFTMPAYNKEAFVAAQSVVTRIFDAIGGTERKMSDDWSGAGHIMGTCRMGDDPSTSVANSAGRAHDHPNLYILGSSLFPTAGTANPTLTALALTLRSLRSITSDLEGR